MSETNRELRGGVVLGSDAREAGGPIIRPGPGWRTHPGPQPAYGATAVAERVIVASAMNPRVKAGLQGVA